MKHGGNAPITNGEPIRCDLEQSRRMARRAMSAKSAQISMNGPTSWVAAVNTISIQEAQMLLDKGLANA